MSDPALTEFEHAYYIGNYMSGILYGVQLVMYFTTLRALHHSKNHWHSNSTSRSRLFFALYITTLTLLLTANIAINAVWGEEMWIKGRQAPGGVGAFVATHASVWYQTLGLTTVVAMIFMGDAFLLFRLYIIYGSNIAVIILPILAYLAAFALAIIELLLAGRPTLFSGKIIHFGLPYYTITISLNILVTVLICLRVRKLSSVMRKALGKESASIYTSVTSMLVESAAPYSLVGVMFLVPYALGRGSSAGFGQVWAKMTCLAPSLIVLRVVSGRAWGRDVITRAEGQLEFAHSHGRTTQSTEASIELHSIGYSGGNVNIDGATTDTEKCVNSTKNIGL